MERLITGSWKTNICYEYNSYAITVHEYFVFPFLVAPETISPNNMAQRKINSSIQNHFSDSLKMNF